MLNSPGNRVEFPKSLPMSEMEQPSPENDKEYLHVPSQS